MGSLQSVSFSSETENILSKRNCVGGNEIIGEVSQRDRGRGKEQSNYGWKCKQHTECTFCMLKSYNIILNYKTTTYNLTLKRGCHHLQVDPICPGYTLALQKPPLQCENSVMTSKTAFCTIIGHMVTMTSCILSCGVRMLGP